MRRWTCLVFLTLSAWGQGLTPRLRQMAFPLFASPVIYGLAEAAEPNGRQFLYPVRSGDDGKTWLPLYLFAVGTQQEASAIAVDPRNPAVVYVGTTPTRGGVWKSTDSGATWTRANTGLPTAGIAGVQNLMAAGNDSQVLYVRSGQTLYKSTDAAATWRMHGDLPGAAGYLELDPVTPTRGYYMQVGARMFRSTNDGVTWTDRGQITVQGGQVNTSADAKCIRFDPRNFDRVFLCLSVTANSGFTLSGTRGPWRSTDGGASFVKMNAFAFTEGELGDFFIDPRGTVINQRVDFINPTYHRRSTDGGETFPEVQVLPPIALDPRNPDVLWGRGASAVSRDAGLTKINTGAVFRPTFARVDAPVVFQVDAGRTLETTYLVRAVEDYTMEFTASKTGAPWLTLPAPTATGNLRLNFSAVGLSPGNYDVTLNLSSPHANLPGTLPIRLEVTAPLTGFQYSIQTIAGGGTGTRSPDGVRALGAQIGSTGAIAFDEAGNLFFETFSSGGWQIRQMDAGGILRTVAGSGGPGTSGNGGPALDAAFSLIEGLAAGRGKLYVSERAFPSSIRLVENGTVGLFVNRIPESITGGFQPGGIALDTAGNLYIAETSGILRVRAGTQTVEVYLRAPNGTLPHDVAVGADGTIVFSARGTNRVYRYKEGSAITEIGGNGGTTFAGDGVATSVPIGGPGPVAIDREGNVFVLDTQAQRIRVITPDGLIRTVAGGGTQSTFAPENFAATDLQLFISAADMAIDPQGNLVFSDGSRIHRLVKDPTPRPRSTQGSFVNAGSNLARISPGVLFSLYGSNLATGTAVASVNPWPTTLAGATVTVEGVAVPLFYASPTQINGQAPYELVAGTTRTAIVTVNGLSAVPVSFTVSPASPGILVFGDNRAVVVNQDGQVNTPATAAPSGSVVVGYFTGTGRLDNPVPTGRAAPAEPLSRPVLRTRAFLGEFECQVFFAGLTPTFIGLGQINFEIPPGLPPGEYPLRIQIGEESSNAPMISVRAP